MNPTTKSNTVFKPFHSVLPALIAGIAVSRRELTSAKTQLMTYGTMIQTAKIPGDVQQVKDAFRAKLGEIKQHDRDVAGEPWVAKTIEALDFQLTHVGNGQIDAATDKQVVAGAQTGSGRTGATDGRRVS